MASKLKLTELLYPTSTTAAITINSDDSVTIPTQSTTNLAYTGTLTGGTGVVNIGSGQVYKDASGNVGIGVSNPASILSVQKYNAAGLGPELILNNNANSISDAMALTFASGTIGSGARGRIQVTVENNPFYGAMQFFTGASNATLTERVRITGDGNVGIGTSSPLAKLQVYPTVGAPASSGNLNTGVIFAEGAGGPSLNMGNFNSGGTYYAWIQSAFVNNAAVVQPLVLQQIGGNVGIGTTSPGYKLDVVGSIKASTQVLGPNGSAATPSISSSGETNAGLFFGDNGVSSFLGFSSGGQERGRFDSSGNLLVGTTSLPTNGAILHSYLSISAGLGYKVKPGQSGTLGGNVFNIDWTGSPQLWIDATNIGTITTTSDYRIKKNITAQTTPALERVMQLRPVNYELADYGTLFKADGIIREGFIAHELAEVIPSAVEGEKDAENQIQSLRLDALCSVLTKAIQELKTEVDALKGAA